MENKDWVILEEGRIVGYINGTEWMNRAIDNLFEQWEKMESSILNYLKKNKNIVSRIE